MFSKTYLKQPATQRDSERLRSRLGATAATAAQSGDTATWFAKLIREETGARVTTKPWGWDIDGFFRDAEMRYVLDAVTCMTSALLREEGEGAARKWVLFCQRAFSEEGLAYRVDDEGEAHYLIDAAFHEMADSVVATLSGGRYVAAGASLNKAVEQIMKADPEHKHAIRDAFEGVEIAFKVASNSNKDLSSGNITALLTPIVNHRFEGRDDVAKGAATQTLESLSDWTNACHKYRHGHNVEEPVEPPLDLTVLLVGNGLNFARRIATLSG